ncbi:heme ABC transporter substrate-binding protein IsdE [Intestinimonas butyriciproducens]|uniref:High-affinity heme uptake system protein IsdE n=1 Tax=Intestinimonas butyriciproducens TaxID=1297617 RepID=A0A0S2W4N2_9FIRM|nr:heme ABC transporter substrate-binding protein IsdE [Intestinimonas butyriciproducens]ALP94289.1 Heme transporter IsdDEF, lipoprotein IsdE [Intestinimonas butyriciproducens]
MKSDIVKKLLSGGLACVMALSLTACVDQHPEESGDVPAGVTASVSEEARIVATSNATLQICDRLGLDLVGIPTTTGSVPERYQGLPEIGTAMAPDAEQIALLEPTDVIGPDTLAETIEPTYQAAGVPYTWIDLQSVQGMYDSITMLGEKYGVEDSADALIAEYEETMAEFEKAIKGKEHPTVLVLMGLPGAYIECTPNSYVGSLVELAGAVNVAQDDFMNFVSWNTEELLELDPDVILLTVHGLPDLAMEMFAEEFTTNDIWKHFRAVQEGQVYQLDYNTFGMSCTFDWPEALEILKEILYDGTYASYDAEAAHIENNT